QSQPASGYWGRLFSCSSMTARPDVTERLTKPGGRDDALEAMDAATAKSVAAEGAVSGSPVVGHWRRRVHLRDQHHRKRTGLPERIVPMGDPAADCCQRIRRAFDG